ncbi:type II secretion system protein GspK [Comamonas sp. NLF-1-9]|uniref:type II secretion system protein GspK n=1 Tax=Comamonas sp. NLF-1-9 TaxID=2853163 RepID=UPI001C443A9B|nr:type II secretion system protein GspK [Comamonas sp. NLF-1-9]QXL83554.1 general secretion pathway protein GspK [Comamonas sp. NLF-1-9]
MSHRCSMTRAARCGVALVAVLWIVAALAIAVAGMLHTVRSEIRVTAADQRLLQVQAAGEAAITLVLQEMAQQRNAARPPLLRSMVSFAGTQMLVQASSLNGYVDLNRASPQLLAQVYEIVGQLDPRSAAALAQATVEARNSPDPAGRPLRFEAPEDLMLIPGVSYDLYARLRGYLVADAQGTGKINPQAAPAGLLSVLAGGDIRQGQALSLARQRDGALMNTSNLRAEFIDNSVGSRYRMQAVVPLADGSAGTFVLFVELTPDRRTGLPWQPLGSQLWLDTSSVEGADFRD